LFGKSDQRQDINCMDIMSGDTIRVYAAKIDLSGYIFKLELLNDAKNIKAARWTDYPAYDGKSSFDLPIEDYRLELNKNSFKTGDTLKARFVVTTGVHKFQSQKMEIKGEIFHIIGGNYYRWKNGISQHQKYWRNGKTGIDKQ
jgi:hypothetical protein